MELEPYKIIVIIASIVAILWLLKGVLPSLAFDMLIQRFFGGCFTAILLISGTMFFLYNGRLF